MVPGWSSRGGLAFVSLFLCVLGGCKTVTPLGNGELRSLPPLVPGSPAFYSITLPVGIHALLVEPGGTAGVMVTLSDPAGRAIVECQLSSPCIVADPVPGKYEIRVQSGVGISGATLSAAWSGGAVETFSETVPLGKTAVPAGAVGVAGFQGGGASSSVDIAITPPSEGDVDLEILDVSGTALANCGAADSCALAGVPSGTYFLRYSSRTGFNALSVIRKPVFVPLEGLWISTAAELRWITFKQLFLDILVAMETWTSDPARIADAFRIETDSIMEEWDAWLRYNNDMMVLELKTVLTALAPLWSGDLAGMKASWSALPDVLVSKNKPACSAARQHTSYIEFFYDPATRLYRFSQGKTGEGTLRSDEACDWHFTQENAGVLALPTDHDVSPAWLQSFVDLAGSGNSVFVASKDRFRIAMSTGFMPGSSVTLSRLVCEADNLPDSMFDFIHQLEGGMKTTGYVPDAKGSMSGVTISVGFDLGARSVGDLQTLGLSPSLISTLTPYLGLKSTAAVEFLKANPLTVSAPEAADIYQKVRSSSLNSLIDRYRKSSRTSYCLLPDAWKTVIASIEFQYGSAMLKTPQFWDMVVNQDWGAALGLLRHFGDNYGNRRNQEADYAQQNT